MKPNDLVFIKTTGEEVLVLAVENKNPLFQGLSGVTITVSRPMLGQNGIEHVVNEFLLEQVETVEERFKREYDMRQRVKDISQTLDKAEATEKATLPN